MGKMETLYAEISDVLDGMESKRQASSHEWSDTCELENHITNLKELMKKERNDYIVSSATVFQYLCLSPIPKSRSLV